MESKTAQIIITEDYGKELFNAAIKLAADRHREGALVSEADLLAGAMCILIELSGDSDSMPSYLVGPALNLLSGRRLILDEFDEKERKKIDQDLTESDLCGTYHKDIMYGLRDILGVTYTLGYHDAIDMVRGISKELLQLLHYDIEGEYDD